MSSKRVFLYALHTAVMGRPDRIAACLVRQVDVLIRGEVDQLHSTITHAERQEGHDFGPTIRFLTVGLEQMEDLRATLKAWLAREDT